MLYNGAIDSTTQIRVLVSDDTGLVPDPIIDVLQGKSRSGSYEGRQTKGYLPGDHPHPEIDSQSGRELV